MVGLSRVWGTFERIDDVALYAALLLVDVVHYCGKDRWFYLSHLRRAILLPNELIQPPQRPSQRRVKMILDIVISSKSHK